MIYTCPMHPQIEQDHPGNCPICGMTLEPKTVMAGSEEDNAELRDMTRRFWIGAALALPVFVLGMAHLFPNAPSWVANDWSRWLQFILSTPVVLWGGWPFFVRGWQSVRIFQHILGWVQTWFGRRLCPSAILLLASGGAISF